MLEKHSIKTNPSSPEERGRRIQFIRKHLLGLSREKFCERPNFVIPHTLKSWELAWGSGLTEKGAGQIVERAKELGIYCTTAWLLYGIGREATRLTREIELSAAAEKQVAIELLAFREQPNTIDSIIADDAMIPFFYPGNYVGGIIVEDIEMAINKDCIIVDNNNDIYVRILKYGEEPGRYNLVSMNQHPNFAKKEIKNVLVKAVAPIVWLRRKNPSKD